MRALTFPTLLLFALTGCSRDRTTQDLTLEQIADLKNGDSYTLSSPDPKAFLEASSNVDIINNLKELSLDRDLSGYTDLALSKFTRLETITLFSTENTDDFLAAVHSNVTTLNLEQTDVTSAGIANMSRFHGLRVLHLSPWNSSFTDAAIECFGRLQQLETLSVEWIDESVLAELKNRFPDLTIKKLPHES